MTEVPQARSLVRTHLTPTSFEQISLEEAMGRYLYSDIRAPFPLPSFRQSAMDGYAFRLDPTRTRYDCIGEVAAGNAENPPLAPRTCVRIFTGARVPDDADTVLIQEWAERHGDEIRIDPERLPGLKVGQHIRPVGEQIDTGERCMMKGTKLNAAGVSFLRSFGIRQVEVALAPRIGLLLTGSELLGPEEDLRDGKIYESNSIAISNALLANDFSLYTLRTVEDDLDATRSAIADLLAKCDVVLISGGISVGDHDHVRAALQEAEVEEIFYKVWQKPGKPFYFGRRDPCSVFALPGNPASALTCLYEYVLTHLRLMCGANEADGLRVRLPLAHDHSVKGDRDVFLKAAVENGRIRILDAQASSMLSSFALADGIVHLPAGQSSFQTDALVDIHLIR